MYKRLFIIGNGFDVAHNLRTKYKDFKEWMIVEYLNMLNEDTSTLSIDEMIQTIKEVDPPMIPSVQSGKHGDSFVDDEEGYRFLLWLLINCPSIGEDWSNFEESLHDLSIEECLHGNSYLADDSAIDKDGIVNPFWQANNYEDLAIGIKSSALLIRKVFNQWMETIDVECEGVYDSLIYKELESTLFLSFNYTETLEKIYKVPSLNVNHIHGLRRESIPYVNDEFVHNIGDLIIGHGNDAAVGFKSNWYEADDILEETISYLLKNTDKIIRDNNNFWKMLQSSEIKEVFSFGFGYSKVDMPYISRIVRCFSLKGQDVEWYLNSFDDSNGKNSLNENKLRECGFMGKIGRFCYR